MNDMTLLYVLTGAFLLYPFARWLHLRITEPLHLRFAEEGKRLLEQKNLTDAEREIIWSMLDDAFAWQFMAIMVVTFPVYTVMGLFDKRFRFDLMARDEQTRAFYNHEDTRYFCRLHDKVIVAANPFCSLILALEIMLMILPALAVSGSLNVVGRMVRAVQLSTIHHAGKMQFRMMFPHDSQPHQQTNHSNGS